MGSRLDAGAATAILHSYEEVLICTFEHWHTLLPSEVSPMDFVDWDHRPAVLVGDKAFAVLRPGGPWVSVDRDDVWYTGGVMTEAAGRKRFVGEFGRLDVLQWRPGQDNPPQLKPLPTAKDFDDAVRAVQAAYLAHLAATSLREIEAPPIAP